LTKNFRQEYEEAFSRFAEVEGARAFGFGRHALAILLKALDVKPGDKVGVCAFTCLAVVEAIKVCQAIPIYLDIDEHLCIDPHEIMIQDKDSLKVVLLQHTFGNPGKFDQLLAACDEIGAKIIEDCAHAPDCFWNDKKLGKWGEGAIGQGGMLTVNSKELLDKVDSLIERFASPASGKSELISAWHRWVHSVFGQSRLDCYLGYKYARLHDMLSSKQASLLKDSFPDFSGYAHLMGEMTAKTKLKHMDDWRKLQQLRRQNTAMMEEHFTKAGLSLWPRQPQANIAMMRYPLRVYKKWEMVHKAGIRGLDIAGWYVSPIHPLTDGDLAKVDYHKGSCPRSEGMIQRLVHLPTDTSLNKRKLEAMIEILNAH